MKTYIINMKTSEARREYVLKEVAWYACMDVELVEAVDGRLFSPAEKEERFDTGRFAFRYGEYPFPGEIGCALSHWECFRRLAESSEETALILEDDVVFTRPERVEKTIEKCDKLLKNKGAGVISLSFPYRIGSFGKRLEYDYYLYRVWKGFGMQAYLIHRVTAEKLLAVKPSVRADDYLYMNLLGIRMYGVLPWMSTGLSFKEISSEIQLSKENITYCRNIPFRYKIRNLFLKAADGAIYVWHVFFRIIMYVRQSK